METANASRLEWVVLILVVLATISLEINRSDDAELDLEVTHISAHVIMATDSSMEVLGLGEYDSDGDAYIELDSHRVTTEDCNDCINNPVGLKLEGTFILENVTKNNGGSYRFEGPISITYLTEYISPDLIGREWLSLNISAGDVSQNLEIILIHDPPRWNPVGSASSSFITTEGGTESRTGPWIFVGQLLESAQNVQGCLPGNSFCTDSTRPDANVTLTVQDSREPIVIPQPHTWELVTSTPSSNETPSKLEDFREMLDLGETMNSTSVWCPHSTQELISTSSWMTTKSDSSTIAPMALWLGALSLPSPSFSLDEGIWNEVDYPEGSCGSLVSNFGDLNMGITLN
jgi:hypothetical protein